jgi:hypothetical protein
VQPSSLKAKNVQNQGGILSAPAGSINLFIGLLPLVFYLFSSYFYSFSFALTHLSCTTRIIDTIVACVAVGLLK